MIYSKELIDGGKYDAVICGGGYAGFAAAYSAAREGLKTILIEQGTMLGGVGTKGLVNHILGVRVVQDDGGYKTCVGGLFGEIEKELVENNSAVDVRNLKLELNPHGWYPVLGVGMIYDNEQMKALLERKLDEIGAEILYSTNIVDVIKDGSKIKGVVVYNKSGLQLIGGDYFVDATGDGDVCFFSGCETMFGDENGDTTPASLEMHVENVNSEKLIRYMNETKDLRFKNIISELKEKGEWDFPYDIFISVMLTQKDVFMINTIRQIGVNGTDGRSLSRAVTSGRKENLKLLEIMKKHFPGFENAKLRQIAPSLGIRETRRVMCEHILSVDDLVYGTEFSDCIAFAGYGWDLPHPKKPSFQPSQATAKKSPYTPIPYRCLLPVGIDNLITAGRCIGVEREVLGIIRVMGPCMAMGEGAGIALGMAHKENISLRDVDIKVLKEKIASYGGITEEEQVK